MKCDIKIPRSCLKMEKSFRRLLSCHIYE